MFYYRISTFLNMLIVRIVIQACLEAWGMTCDLEREHGHASKYFAVPPTLDKRLQVIEPKRGEVEVLYCG